MILHEYIKVFLSAKHLKPKKWTLNWICCLYLNLLQESREILLCHFNVKILFESTWNLVVLWILVYMRVGEANKLSVYYNSFLVSSSSPEHRQMTHLWNFTWDYHISVVPNVMLLTTLLQCQNMFGLVCNWFKYDPLKMTMNSTWCSMSQ